MIELQDLTTAGRVLAIYGVAMGALWLLMPARIEAILAERTAMAGLLVAGFLAIVSGFILATIGG